MLSSSRLYCQNAKRLLLLKTLFLIISGLLIYYRYLVESEYKVNNFPIAVPVPANESVNYDDSLKIFDDNDNEELNTVDISDISIAKPENKFRVNLDELQLNYQVSDIIRIVIEPCHSSLVNKLKSSFFRVQVIGPTIFAPQLVSSPNSSVLVYEAPLTDQGTYKMRVRILFYDQPEIYSLVDPEKSSYVDKLDRVIVNGEFTFKVEQSLEWDRLNLQLPNSCADISILSGRWKKDLSQFLPYNCIIPTYQPYQFLELLEMNNMNNNNNNNNNNIGSSKFVDFNNLPFRYTWIRFLGDSNMRKLFQIMSREMGSSCNWVIDGQNKDKRTQYICKMDYNKSQFLGEKDPRPREVYMTYEWYYPKSRYNLKTLLNNTFEQTCKPFQKEGPCDFVNSNDFASSSSLKNICSTKRADYTFVSIGSHTPEWVDKQNDEYLEEIFQFIRENHYQEKITFVTTNAVNIRKIPKHYRNQYLIRNNFRISRANELLKKHVDKSKEVGYRNIDLLDFFGTTQPIWEFSSDAVHYDVPLYKQQVLLIFDRLISYIKSLT